MLKKKNLFYGQKSLNKTLTRFKLILPERKFFSRVLIIKIDLTKATIENS